MAGASGQYGQQRRLGAAKQHEFSIVSDFKYGYRNREDVTNLPPGVLIVGSQNVITNVSDRVQIRQGYALDGLVSYIAAPVLSSFDWLSKTNGEIHMRAGRLTSAGNDGKLQFRYVASGNELGDNQVSNGKFTGNATGWSSYTGSTNNGALPSGNWAYNANNILHTAGATANVGQLADLSPLTNYHVSFDVGGTTGSVYFLLNDAVFGPYAAGGPGPSTTFLSGSYTGGYDGLFLIEPTSDFDGTIDNVSVNLTLTADYVYWKNILTGLTTVSYNFCTYWNILENDHGGTALGLREVLFVNGTSNIFRWNGASAVILSSTAATITKTGTVSWRESGFYNVADKSLVINGNTYTYTGGESTTTLTGVSPTPVGEPIGSIVIQSVVTVANSAMTDMPAAFAEDLIGNLNNQIYVGSTQSSALYLSNVNSYTDYSSSTPRAADEGGFLILDANLTGFVTQGAQDSPSMYVTAGQDLWYKSTFTDFVDVSGASGQNFGMLLIKTGKRQGPMSQAFLSNMKNNVIVATYETTIDMVGLAENFFTQAQAQNLSDPIKLDIDDYDFTDGSIAYWRYYILLAVPKEGIVRIYNLATKSWEAPQTLPISRFYIVDGELYGHSYSTFESYQLFVGYADRVDVGFTGFPIAATWRFSYQNYGTRFALKKATKMYVEGYINSNTTLTTRIIYELDGCQTVKTFQLDGSDSQFVCVSGGEGSLGKASLGKLKLGGDQINSINNLPPKFRWFPTFTNTDFFENSVEFSVLGTDERMELLAFGLAVSGSSEIPVQNMD